MSRSDAELIDPMKAYCVEACRLANMCKNPWARAAVVIGSCRGHLPYDDQIAVLDQKLDDIVTEFQQ